MSSANGLGSGNFKLEKRSMNSENKIFTDQEKEALCDVFITTKKYAKDLKTLLEKNKIFNRKFRIKNLNEDQVAVPIDLEKWKGDIEEISFDGSKCQDHTQMLMPFSKTHLIRLSTVQKTIQEEIIDLFYMKTRESLSIQLLKDLPCEWQIHGDMLLLPKDCLQLAIWDKVIPELWCIFCKVLKIKRIAKHCIISDNEFRSSKIQMLYGEDGWITRKENSIQYMYDITKCMFSDGNITEKMRIAKFDCQNEVVVDLFAGIGYFVIPYLVHAGAKMVYACEWNPDAIEALKKNLEINNVSGRCIVLDGDNRKVAPKGIADRVNLGLIPSSHESWQAACEALNPTKGGWLHIHANVNQLEHKNHLDGRDPTGMVKLPLKQNSREYKSQVWMQWAEDAILEFKELLKRGHADGPCNWTCEVEHIEHVKAYAPHIDHIVVDVKCTPVYLH
eukprot:gene12873-3622_t